MCVCEVNLPKPAAILARLFVVLNRPNLQKRYGQHICSCMQHIGGIIHESLKETWEENFKILENFLEEKRGEEMEKKFGTMVLKLFKETCAQLKGDDTMIQQIGDSLYEQWLSYNGMKDLQETVLVYLGQVLQYSSYQSWIRKRVEESFDMIEPGVVEHQEGLALGLGLCAGEHIDIVLLRCSETAKSLVLLQTYLINNHDYMYMYVCICVFLVSLEKKSSGFLGLGGKKAAPGHKEKKACC
ncbi:hypothetical protein RFI_17831 [Reticulomyxa filosa]|uniref:MROH2B-like HEAT-repeats domain-containing protein n=1 Tax=Reticulomyxa filosa TaxID=46433 RepID=X6N0K3_RETFI|nr:hypothetical protein RFI_17831 [Reticulomyxa filosa]|eukprot:ETO19398.1 hypothetical protein RFI_17831 [Reticulomyxa filosa]